MRKKILPHAEIHPDEFSRGGGTPHGIFLILFVLAAIGVLTIENTPSWVWTVMKIIITAILFPFYTCIFIGGVLIKLVAFKNTVWKIPMPIGTLVIS